MKLPQLYLVTRSTARTPGDAPGYLRAYFYGLPDDPRFAVLYSTN